MNGRYVWRRMVTIGLFSSPDFYAAARHVVLTSVFPGVEVDLERPIRPGLCGLLDRDFGEHLFYEVG